MPRSEHPRARLGPWIVACALCAAAGFLAGRHAPAPRPAHAAPDAHPSRPQAAASARARPSPASADLAADPVVSPHAPVAERRRALIGLLQRLRTREDQENMGDMIKLATWVQVSGEDDLAEALAIGAELGTEEHSPLENFLPLIVFNRWAALNGPAALEAYLETPEERRPSEAVAMLFKSWAAEGDPQDAIDHLLALRRTDPDAADGDILGLILGDWSRKAPDDALASARRFALSADPQERSAAGEFAREMASRVLAGENTAAALSWIDDWPDAAARDNLRLSLLRRLPESASDEASAEIVARLESADSLANSGHLRGKVRRLADKDIDAALVWCATLPPASRAASAEILSEQLSAKGRWREAVSWAERQITDPAARASSYERASIAAATQGDLAEALRLSTLSAPRGDNDQPTPPEHTPVLVAWLQADPARAEFLLARAREFPAPPP